MSQDLRIGLEVTHDPAWPAGLLYVRNLVYTLASLPAELCPQIRLLPVDANVVRQVRDLEQRYSFVSIAAGGAHSRMTDVRLFLRRIHRKYVQSRSRRLVLRPFGGLDVTYPGWGTPIPGVPQIQWIPDFQHVHLPHLFSTEEIRRRQSRIATIAMSDCVLVLSSDAAKRDFEEIHRNAKSRVHVWRFCSTITEAEKGGRDPRSTWGLPAKYLYIANQFWVHKDHETAFTALILLRERGRHVPTLACTGLMHDPRNEDHVPRLQRFLHDNDLLPHVRLLGHLSRADQVAVLRHSSAVIQPSRFEGWSTVVEDAKAVGRPLFLSDIPVHLEQEPSAYFFEAGNAEELASALERSADRLAEGPDPDAEQKAQQKTERRRLELANQFLQIVSSAISRSRQEPREVPDTRST